MKMKSSEAEHSFRRPLNIGIDGRPLMEGEIRGFSRYTMELVRALSESFDGSIRLFSFSPDHVHEIFRSTLKMEQVVFRARRELLWEQYELPRRLKIHGIDIFHATANRGLPGWRVCRYILTLHDLIETMSEYVSRGPIKSYLRRRYADTLSINAADRIITVSEHSRRDICERYRKLTPGNVRVIYEAASRLFYVKVPPGEIAAIKRKYGLPPKYLLYLGGFDKKKNVERLVEAYRLSSGKVPPLVLAGDKKWDFAKVQTKIENLDLTGKVVTPGKIEDVDLPGLYQGANAFIYPSMYEGFGLQLIEAMASGIPVLASDRTCFPEVLNGAGLLFDPERADSIATQLNAISSDQDLRANLIRRSEERAKYFSWEKTAAETMSVYREVCGVGVGAHR
jgi:glycosyltransferase involved in cell wall biosynthesis